MKFLVRTPNDPAMLLARLALAAAIFPHGAQKVLGWFGGPGMEAAVEGMTSGFDLDPWMVYGVMAAEFLGPIALLVGFLSRIAALGIGAVMVGAVYLAHWERGFFMDWYGTFEEAPFEGFEYHILAIGLALAILIRGAGALSIDRALGKPKTTASY